MVVADIVFFVVLFTVICNIGFWLAVRTATRSAFTEVRNLRRQVATYRQGFDSVRSIAAEHSDIDHPLANLIIAKIAEYDRKAL